MLNTGRRLVRQARQTSFQRIYPIFPEVHNFVFFELRRRLIGTISLMRARPLQRLPDIFTPSNTKPGQFMPLVSVIVPCYNHAPYLRHRLQSIAEQSYANIEIILLDDCSTDGSQEILQDFASQRPEITTLILNSTNSGKPFGQWARGIRAARGELIWIAESDDFCSANFLAELVPQFRNRGVMLALGRTLFVDSTGQRQVWSLEQYLPAMGPRFWQKPFTETAHTLLLKIWAQQNLVPNASGCLFRKPRHHALLDQGWWQQLRVCGDWLFYLELVRGGLVAYTPATTNSYRQHAANSSVEQHHSRRYFDEHLRTAQWICSHHPLSKRAIRNLRKELKRRWPIETLGAMPQADEQAVTHLTAHPPGQPASGRRPSLLMITYGLMGGGGEVFPIRLANGLRQRGYSVTLLNCNQRPSEPAVEAMVDPDVPLITLQRLQDLGLLVLNLGIDIVHSHHAWVDTTTAELLQGFPHVRHVITSHGMYDYMDGHELNRIGRILKPAVAAAAYVSATNLPALQQLQLELNSPCLQQIPNAAERPTLNPISRQLLGIPEESVLICLVSRAIREKGWREAIAAMALLRQWQSRDVQLLLVGDGPMASELKSSYGHLPYLHFLGFRPNTCDFFAASDLGLLPSFFSGESQPLTLIECLLAGTPYVASDTGEIAAMLQCEQGLAGSLIPMRNNHCSPEDIATALLPYLTDPLLIREHASRTALAARKFSWDTLLDRYERLYQQALHTQPSQQAQPPLAEVHPGTMKIHQS